MSTRDTAPLPKDNPHHHTVNLRFDPNHNLTIEGLSTLTSRAQSSLNELEDELQSKLSNAKSNPKRYLVISMWILTNWLANENINLISSFIKDSQAMKNTDIFAKLELDFITINFLLSLHLTLTQLKIAFIRILDVKSDPHHLNQQERMFDMITSMSDNLNCTTAHFMQQFSCAMGSATKSNLLDRLHSATMMSGIHTTFLKTFKNVLISHPLHKANVFLHSDKGKEVMHWAFTALKLFTPGNMADTLENTFGLLLEKCPLSQPDVGERKNAIQNPLREVGTIRFRTRPSEDDAFGDAI